MPVIWALARRGSGSPTSSTYMRCSSEALELVVLYAEAEPAKSRRAAWRRCGATRSSAFFSSGTISSGSKLCERARPPGPGLHFYGPEPPPCSGPNEPSGAFSGCRRPWCARLAGRTTQILTRRSSAAGRRRCCLRRGLLRRSSRRRIPQGKPSHRRRHSDRP